MTRPLRMSLLAGLIALLFAPAISAQPRMPEPTPPAEKEAWEKTARQQKLTEEEIKLLRKQKFLVTGNAVRQVFSPYTGSDVPVFITSDSILNAYHVLLEESIYRIELANSRKLPSVLEQLSKNLDATAAKMKGDAALIKAAKERAAIFLGVARNLLDEKALPDDADRKTIIRDEVTRIVAGSGAKKPAWLGPPDERFLAIEYTRFKPRGFYTRTPTLQRYFRAIAWLQAIPFRLEKDEELAAFALMYRAYFDCDPKAAPDTSIWRSFQVFLGDRDDWDLANAWWVPKELTRAALDKVRDERKDTKERSQINDQLRFAPSEPGGKPELALRFLSAYRLPDAVMFQRTMSPGGVKREFPSGVDVAAALGSPFARDKLTKDRPALLKEIDAARPLFKGDNLYADYLRCLGTLMERTEPDAPEFMRSEPWRIKTTQSALAGWAQMRHTWALQAKTGANWIGEAQTESGFVEPVPEFYGRLVKLLNDTKETLAGSGALKEDDKVSLEELGKDVSRAKALVSQALEKQSKLNSFTNEERALLSNFDPRLECEWDITSKEDSVKSLKGVQRLLVYYGWIAEGDKDAALMVGFSLGGNERKWTTLSSLCHRLHALSNKQLQHMPFNDEENKFILNYGKSLADVMFHSGNSWLTPKDDAMRVADVFSNPSAGGYLHVGSARPRLMWVLYPTKNGEVLCRGAIVPYAEFVNAGRLTDGEWKTLLDSPNRPEIPSWAKSVIPPEQQRDKGEK